MEQAPTPTTTATMPSQPVEKKRYEWIDNARIIAAFLIMFLHLLSKTDFGTIWGSEYIQLLVLNLTYCGRVPLFLILAGYFLSRNITWKKAFDRFFWLLVPLIIWNAIFFYIIENQPFTLKGILPNLLGFNCFFIGSALPIFGNDMPTVPAIGPTWFLRDIMLLSLATPIIDKFKKWIPAMLIIIASLSSFNVPPTPTSCLTPPTVFFYLFGVLLARYRISDAYRIFNPSFTPIVIFGVFVSFLFVSTGRAIHFKGMEVEMFKLKYATCIGMIFGAMIIAHAGVLIEKHLPNLSRKLAPCGPACFLVFVLHDPIFFLLMKVIPSDIWNSFYILLLPIPTFCFITCIFLAMKKYTPWLMPYLGHMKVSKRPLKTNR